MLHSRSGRDNIFEVIAYFILIMRTRNEVMEKKLGIEEFSNSLIRFWNEKLGKLNNRTRYKILLSYFRYYKN